MTEPKRLLDDPTTDAELRRALDGARAHTPPLNVASGLARLEQAAEQAATPAASTLLGPAALGVLALALATGVGALLWATNARDERELHRDPAREDAAPIAALPAPPEAPARTAPASEDEPTELAPTAPSGELEPAAPEAPRAASRRREARTTSASGEPSADLAALEIRLVGEARHVVATDPSGALALLRQLDREVGTGFLGVEREGLAVLALAGSGARAEAARRGERFLAQHPDGALAERVRRALAPSE